MCAVPDLSRRQLLGGVAATPLLLFVGAHTAARATAPAARYRYLTAHEAAVVVAATARLVPGPLDDPAEAGHPGAREADVVRYIDTLLAAFDDDPPRVFAGAPWSDRHASGPDLLARFLPPSPAHEYAWRRRVADLRRQYRAAVRALDAAAGGDFTGVPPVEQDRILTDDDAVRALLFTHTIEGLYALPEYGGNAGLSGWREISYPGDVQPRGYSATQVERSDGPDPVTTALPVPFADAALALVRIGRLRG